MKLLKTASTLIASAAVAAAIAAPAQAVRLSVGTACQQELGYACSKVAAKTADGKAQGLTTNVRGATVIDFNSARVNNRRFTSGLATYSNLRDNFVDNSRSSHHALPAGDQTRYLTITNDRNRTGGTGFVDINFSKAMDYFGMYWGSIDNHNEIEFYSGNTLLRRLTGANIPQAGGGSWTSARDNVYVNFFANPGQNWNRIRLVARGTAFESDNHAYRQAVPEPLTLGGTALAVGAVLRLRKKRQAKQA